MDLLERLKLSFPGAELRSFKDLGRPCYIVSVDGVDLKVTELHPGVAGSSPNSFEGMLPRGPIYHNSPKDD